MGGICGGVGQECVTADGSQDSLVTCLEIIISGLLLFSGISIVCVPYLLFFPSVFSCFFFQLFSMVSIVSGSPEPAWPIHLHNFFLPQGVSSGSCPHSRVSSMVGNVIKYIYICIVHRGMPLFLLCVSCVCAQG